MGTSVQVTVTGPVLTGKTGPIVEDFLREGQQLVAEEGLQLVRRTLQPRLQHPTGRYMRSLSVVRDSTAPRVTDGGIVYGPWLEGVGRRNARTRFKGYRHWRTTRQQLAQRAAAIAERALPKHLDRLRGR